MFQRINCQFIKHLSNVTNGCWRLPCLKCQFRAMFIRGFACARLQQTHLLSDVNVNDSKHSPHLNFFSFSLRIYQCLHMALILVQYARISVGIQCFEWFLTLYVHFFLCLLCIFFIRTSRLMWLIGQCWIRSVHEMTSSQKQLKQLKTMLVHVSSQLTRKNRNQNQQPQKMNNVFAKYALAGNVFFIYIQLHANYLANRYRFPILHTNT